MGIRASSSASSSSRQFSSPSLPTGAAPAAPDARPAVRGNKPTTSTTPNNNTRAEQLGKIRDLIKDDQQHRGGQQKSPQQLPAHDGLQESSSSTSTSAAAAFQGRQEQHEVVHTMKNKNNDNTSTSSLRDLAEVLKIVDHHEEFSNSIKSSKEQDDDDREEDGRSASLASTSMPLRSGPGGVTSSSGAIVESPSSANNAPSSVWSYPLYSKKKSTAAGSDATKETESSNKQKANLFFFSSPPTPADRTRARKVFPFGLSYSSSSSSSLSGVPGRSSARSSPTASSVIPNTFYYPRMTKNEKLSRTAPTHPPPADDDAPQPYRKAAPWSNSMRMRGYDTILPLYYDDGEVVASEQELALTAWKKLSDNSALGYRKLLLSSTSSGGAAVAVGGAAAPSSSYQPAYAVFDRNSAVSMFYDLFFLRLFDVHPASAAYFAADGKNSSPLQKRAKYLVKLIYLCLSVITVDHKRFSNLLPELIVDQCELGIKPFDNGVMGEVLFWTLREVLLEDYTDAVDSAWTKVYSRVLSAIVPCAVKFEMQNKLKQLVNNKGSSCKDDIQGFGKQFTLSRRSSRLSGLSGLVESRGSSFRGTGTGTGTGGNIFDQQNRGRGNSPAPPRRPSSQAVVPPPRDRRPPPLQSSAVGMGSSARSIDSMLDESAGWTVDPLDKQSADKEENSPRDGAECDTKVAEEELESLAGTSIMASTTATTTSRGGTMTMTTSSSFSIPQPAAAAVRPRPLASSISAAATAALEDGTPQQEILVSSVKRNTTTKNTFSAPRR